MPAAPQEICELVATFQRNQRYYIGDTYNEAQARAEFIDKFFIALGWDVANIRGYAPQFREVLTEAALGGKQGAATPDYTFRHGSDVLFFVEAKKPQVRIAENAQAAFQLRRYAWSKGLKASILTDFQEFAVYDCQLKPSHNDRASDGRVLLATCDEYPVRWGEIASIFAREAVLKGEFANWAATNTGKHGTQTVDAAFLADMSAWREQLARNLALRNPALTEGDLNYAVQMTLDRIVFLRICEDRGIEPYGVLRDAALSREIYPRLLELFRAADQRYNSGLFHLAPERGREQPDTLTPSLKLDDPPLKEIIGKLYWPSPYDFNQMPVEILGRVYEQFLGSVIRLTLAHQAKVEEKPEVRKAGGVYYTPQYIVRYIVEHTVGELLKDKSPAELLDLAICDPACGSGSFLLGAYEYLMNFYLNWYVAQPDARKRRELRPASGGGYELALEEKKRILTRHIYGVDIDQQAVEVTKLSLLLKVLEGESAGSMQLKLLQERALPDLAHNIRCGNSLIGWDYPGAADLSNEDTKRINPFDWQSAFPRVFARGGFDAVIGNPPYSAKQSVETKQLIPLFSSIEYKCDPYGFFIEQGLRKSRNGGMLGYIIPVTWMTNYYYRKIRELLIRTNSLNKIVLINGLVFKQANVDTCLLFLAKSSVGSREFEWSIGTPVNLEGATVLRKYEQVESEDRYDIIPGVDERWLVLRTKLDSLSVRFDKLGKISLGMKLRANKEFVTDKCDESHPDPIYFGSDISRYGYLTPTRFFYYEKAIIVGGTKNAVIQRFKDKILIQAIRNLKLHRRIVAAYEPQGAYFIGTLNAYTPRIIEYEVKYILGLINSKLLNEYFKYRFTTISLTSAFLGALPIRTIDFSSHADVARHDRMVQLVERMLQLHKDLATAATPHDRELLIRQISATDAAIDRLVYELYDLSAEEINLVEGNV